MTEVYHPGTLASFVCFYYGATGSTWLVETLGSSPKVWVPGFEPVEQHAWIAPDEDKIQWIRNALNPPVDQPEAFNFWWEKLRSSPQVRDRYLSGLTTVGFKMSTSALDHPEKLIDAFAESRTRLIFLMRHNRIKHALSLYRYQEEQKSQFEEKGMLPPSKLDLDLFDKWLERSVVLDQQMSDYRDTCIDRLGEEAVATVAYEDMVSEEGKNRMITDLCSFLDLDPTQLRPSQVAKATPDDLQSAVVNFRRLVRRYRRTPFSVHLTSK